MSSVACEWSSAGGPVNIVQVEVHSGLAIEQPGQIEPGQGFPEAIQPGLLRPLLAWAIDP
jgi:hypothetical protein